MTIRLYILALVLAFFTMTTVPAEAQESSKKTAKTSSKSAKKKKKQKSKKFVWQTKNKKKSKSKKAKDEEEFDEEDELDEDEDAGGEKNPVMTALEKFKVFNGKPNAKADYYIYFYTSSTCVHCVNCMGVAVEQYKEMKKSRKVEMIIVCADNTEDAANAYLKKSKMSAPCIMFSELQATKFRGLPGCGMPLPPSISVVSASEGKSVKTATGGGQVQEALKAWKSYTIEK